MGRLRRPETGLSFVFEVTLWATCWSAELLPRNKAATSSTLGSDQKGRLMPCGCAQDGIPALLKGLLCWDSWSEQGGHCNPVSTMWLQCTGTGCTGEAAPGTPEKSGGRGEWARWWKKSPATKSSWGLHDMSHPCYQQKPCKGQLLHYLAWLACQGWGGLIKVKQPALELKVLCKYKVNSHTLLYSPVPYMWIGE